MSGRCPKQPLLILFFAIVCFFDNNLFATLTTLAKNDPYPVFTSLNPNEFLLTKEILEYKGVKWANQKGDRIRISISPFAQNADHGVNFRGAREVGFCEDDTNKHCTELGNLEGKWSMVAMLFGCLPCGRVLPPTLQEAKETLFPGVSGPLLDKKLLDPNELCGFFSVPLKYRKRGLRFDLATGIIGGFGVEFQTGIADICQTVIKFTDLTADSTEACFTCNTCDVKNSLMFELKNIADEICLDICDFHELSIEEIRINLFWSRLYELGRECEDWRRALFNPFFMFSGSVSPGKRKNESQAFALPFGNNGHNAIGMSFGFNFDFIDTIELGSEIGFTHFFDRCISCFRMPNFDCQSSIFPFSTTVDLSPGHNWHFALKLATYHFIECLSFWFQYVMIDHGKDTIKLKECDNAFQPDVLECRSNWKSKLLNIGFNYDVSPNIGLGFFWQAPLSQRNTYKSTTLLFSLNAYF